MIMLKKASLATALGIAGGLVVGSALAATAAKAAPAAGRQFSADVTQTLSGQGAGRKMTKMTIVSKVYVSGNKSRMETTTAGQQSVTIERGDKKVVWMLDPNTKTYMEMNARANLTFDEMTDPAAIRRQPNVKDVRLIGQETVNGYQCDKYSIIPTTKQGPAGTVWVSRKIKLPMRMQMKSPQMSMTMEVSNVREGPQPAKLFEIPAGYKKQAMPQMGRMPGMPQPPKH